MRSKIEPRLALLLFQQGVTLSDIGARFGVGKQAVYAFIKRRHDATELYAVRKQAKRETKLHRTYRRCALASCGAGFYDLNGGKKYCSSKCRFKHRKELQCTS